MIKQEADKNDNDYSSSSSEIERAQDDKFGVVSDVMMKVTRNESQGDGFEDLTEIDTHNTFGAVI